MIRRRRGSRDQAPPDRAALMERERELMAELAKVRRQLPPSRETAVVSAPEHR